MIVERTRTIAAPAPAVIALLTNVDQLGNLLPRASRVEVLQRGEGRARIAIIIQPPRLKAQRLDGEARLLEDGLRFVAVTPTQIDVRWTVRPEAEGSKVTLRLEADLTKLLGPLGRFVPKQLIERQAGEELQASLDALERLTTGGTPPTST